MMRADERRDEFWWAEPKLRSLLQSDPAAAIRSLGLKVPEAAPTEALIEAAKVVSVVWQDGSVIAKREFTLSPDDEGILFGRGVWESTRTVAGRPWLWDAHLDRFKNTAKLLDIYLDPQRIPSANTVVRYVKELTNMDVIIRLNASAGGNGRPGTIWMSASLPPAPLAAVRLETCRNPVPKGQPYLMWKTFQYATRLRTGKPTTPGFDSTLLIDAYDRVLEAAHANIFVRTDSGWATPVADGGLLPGTVRGYLLDSCPIPVAERVIQRSELREVREAFLTNSNVVLVPVTKIDGQVYPIGEETRRLSLWLQRETIFEQKPLIAAMV